MSEFEFVLIFVSIILGLGMSDLLTVFARILRREFSGGVVHALWALHVAALVLQQFWSKWHASNVTDWSVFQLAFFITPSFLAFLAAALLSPSSVEGGELDPYFTGRRRAFFGVLSCLMVSYSFERWFLDGPDGLIGRVVNVAGLPLTSADGVSLVFIVVYGAAAYRSDRRTQVLLAVLATGLLAAFTVGWTQTLSQLTPGGA